MPRVKDAPRTCTTITVGADSKLRISNSLDPFRQLMERLFQEEATIERGRKFLEMIYQRQNDKNPLRIDEWNYIITEFNISRSAFYGMRNKLLGAGLISMRDREYHLSGKFSKDLHDMARWWWVAVLGNDEDNL